EVVGRTIDEAVQKGLEVLGLRRDQVNVEIVSDGARTVLGFRAGSVRVRVAQKKRPVEPPVAPAAPMPTVATEEAPVAIEGAPAVEPSAPRDSTGEAETARLILDELLKRMGVRARVDVQLADGDEPLRLNVSGKNLGMLIGRRGDTLAAIQFLTRLMVSHQLERWVNLVVDVDDYRRKREETLQRLALRMAEQATETGRVQELEPMPAAERRIVHLALRDFDGVSTQSAGEGEARRVTIIPARSKKA
ncbi:MAG: RNA-binding cell elongation regulator Jag/EloR, partial [Anaerolineae bacterium]